MSWDTAILQPEMGLRFVLQIQGIRNLLLDGGAIIGSDGDAMAAPTSDGNSYLWTEHALDAHRIEDRGAEVSRLTSSVSAVSMTFTIQDDRAGTILDLFAWDRDGGAVANLTASAAYDTGASGTIVLSVDAHSFSIGDYIWLGRECLKITGETATTLTCDRDLFSIGDEDARYVHLSDVAAAPRIVTDWPRALVGRYVRLYAVIVDRFGRALDRTWGGIHQREIWRGFITSNPLPDTSWYRWRLSCDGLETSLRAEVGAEFIGGSLIRVPGTATQNKAGSAQPPEGMPGTPMVIYVADGLNKVHVFVTESDGTEHDYTEDNAFELTTGSFSESGFQSMWKEIISDVIKAATTLDEARLKILPVNHGWRVHLSSLTNPAKETLCEVFWDAAESIGVQLGFSGISIMDPAGLGKYPQWADSGTESAAVWIPQWAQAIPFYYSDDSGQNSVTEPGSSGYAMIGEDDEGEIVSYTSIADLSDTAGVGIFELQGVKRARMGTVAKPIVIARSEIASAPDEVSVLFGVGWEYTNALQVILELAQSTGGGHHGTYDTLPETAGAALNPAHFDTAQIMEVGANLSPSLATVSLFISQATKLGDLASDLLSPMGVVLQARDGEDGYGIQAVEVLPPLESDATATVDDAQLAMSNPALHRAGRTLVNRIEVKYHWDAAKEEADDGAIITVRDNVSFHDHPHSGTTLDWTLVGRRLSAAQALAMVSSQARTIFSLYGQPYEVLDLPVDRAGWLVEPGQTIALTLAGVPTARGARGVTDRLCTVVSVAKTWAGKQPGATLRVLMGRYARRSTYVPCAKASDISGAAVTCEENQYTDTGADADHFEAGNVCWIYEEFGDVSSRVERTILTVSGNVLTFTASVGFAAGSHTIITGADYDVAAFSQRQHVHIADGSTPPVLSVSNVEAFRYV